LATDFESGADGWTHQVMDGVSGSWTFDHWQFGTATSGPGSCFSGSQCWATNLTGNYVQCQRAELRSPVMDLSDCANENLVLSFQHAFDFWTGSWNSTVWYDGALVEFSSDGGTSWALPPGAVYPGTITINPQMGSSYSCLDANGFWLHGRPGYVGQGTGWTRVTIPIPPTFRTPQFRARFAYASGVSSQTTNQNTSMQHTRPGWYVDDVAVEQSVP
jgi:hypothetical protein